MKVLHVKRAYGPTNSDDAIADEQKTYHQ